MVLQAQRLPAPGRGAGCCDYRGGQGLYADDGERTIEMGAFSMPQVDPSGCGDCLTAGWVAGLLRAWDLVRVLEFGSAVGALGATAFSRAWAC